MDTVVLSVRVPTLVAERFDAVRRARRYSRQEVLYPVVVEAIEKFADSKEEEPNAVAQAAA